MTWVAAAVGVAGVAVTAGKAISDGSQKRKAERASKNMLKNRPKYEIPQEIFQNQAMYEAMAGSSRVPGQSQIEDRIAQNTSQAIGASQRAAGSSVDALSAVSNINQNANNMQNNLGIQGAEYQMMAKDKLAASRGLMADYKNQRFDYNKNQPWQIAYAQKQKQLDQQKIDSENTYNSLSQTLPSAVGAIGNGYTSTRK
jgi:hypothetical protein